MALFLFADFFVFFLIYFFFSTYLYRCAINWFD